MIISLRSINQLLYAMSKDCVLFVDGSEILCKRYTNANFQKFITRESLRMGYFTVIYEY